MSVIIFCKKIIMKSLGYIVFALLPAALLLSSCYYDSDEYIYPQITSQCDTASVMYAKSIVPIIQNHCLSCHGNTTSAVGNSIKLEDYADIKGRADDHSLLGAVAREGGYSAMPKNAAKLDECKIATIRIWVNAGAPDN